MFGLQVDFFLEKICIDGSGLDPMLPQFSRAGWAAVSVEDGAQSFTSWDPGMFWSLEAQDRQALQTQDLS